MWIQSQVPGRSDLSLSGKVIVDSNTLGLPNISCLFISYLDQPEEMFLNPLLGFTQPDTPTVEGKQWCPLVWNLNLAL